jgi:hypothetical protein
MFAGSPLTARRPNPRPQVNFSPWPKSLLLLVKVAPDMLVPA